MKEKNIEGKFSLDMDNYLNNIESINKSSSKEYAELLKLGSTLANKDFSKNSNKELVFNKIMKNINENKGDNTMKKSNIIRRSLITAASFAVICVSLTQISFARDLAEKIVNQISLGHITAVQSEMPKESDYIIPASLKGKIFDKNGKELDIFPKDKNARVYTASGEEICSVNPAKGEIVTASEQKELDKKVEQNTVIVRDAANLSQYTTFKVLLPSYLPQGYKFDRAELMQNDNGDIHNNKYIDLYFVNEKTGKNFYIAQRASSEKYEIGTDSKIKKVKVNGNDAIVYDKNIDWEFGDVLYSILGKKSDVSIAELIKVADSVKAN